MSQKVTLLVVGLGWTGEYVVRHLTSIGVSHAATTTTGRNGTVPFRFDPSSTDPTPYKALPSASTVLITFPLLTKSAPETFRSLYFATHADAPNIILLGSTRFWLCSGGIAWADRHTAPDPSTNADRQVAEEAVLAFGGAVLNLAGLWGGTRQPRNWVSRVAATKEALRGAGSVHLVHGEDVARAVWALAEDFTPGERWLLTDGRVYDWWDLASVWGSAGAVGRGKPPVGPHAGWVRELMAETGVRGLPRTPAELGRALDSSEFWTRFNISPFWPRADDERAAL
ncbi:hypothetical protein BDK51DRAFT_27101 [Blyttiomyces helicus]|uniref:NAD(P)-binding domain-containing protein n=1 Tax=Blyttiomyces helicus TaxID=388810 RepID=A0A4P9WHZ3_9FUNG|nr:hypothetical protein BDK51DRAFT_27101 [Blyttiomyces helicus]|eukprot:RKO91058.1 hypothetical protein BDK51DRAFT_27101 [Blyttiomyces helicus]